MHAQIYNGQIDLHHILHTYSLGGCSDNFESPSKLVKGFWVGGGVKFGLSFGIDF